EIRRAPIGRARAGGLARRREEVFTDVLAELSVTLPLRLVEVLVRRGLLREERVRALVLDNVPCLVAHGAGFEQQQPAEGIVIQIMNTREQRVPPRTGRACLRRCLAWRGGFE